MQVFNCREKKWEYVEPAPLTDEEIAELQEQADRDAERAKVLERTRQPCIGHGICVFPAMRQGRCRV